MADELKWLGLSEAKVRETLKNSALSDRLVKIVSLAKDELNRIGGDGKASKQQGIHLYQLGTRLKSQCDHYIPLLVRHVMNENIRNDAQLSAAIDFLLSHAITGVDEVSFLDACGVGVTITVEQIEDQVGLAIKKHREEILKQRYEFNTGRILGDVKMVLRWADGSAIKREVDLRLMELLGPKGEDEINPKKKKLALNSKDVTARSTPAQRGKQSAVQKTDVNERELEGASSIEELMRNRTNFHRVGENYKTDGYVITPYTMELLQMHVKAVNGKVRTRFPPEPNGILHIGHAKAININFGYAKAHGGLCYLRYDDTNPEKEEEKFVASIRDIIGWLGYTPAQVTHSSDYFDQLYKWAVELITKDLAYVCHQKVEEMRGFDVKPSPWRNRPVEESLQLFEDMRRGKFDEGEATLRLKTVLEEGKLDPVAYRIKYTAHHRTGNKWCIYPTYDFTHCLCDSIENITHSLCTKEFQSRRSSYYWLCNALNIYCPVQWEYGRLNVYYAVVSKRKIKALIDNRIVSDWDDPRLFTLTALRRRGIPPEAINSFVAGLGLTTAQMIVDPHMLDAYTREYLNTHAPRTMVVLEPLKLTITNYEDLHLPSRIEVPDFPSNPEDKKKHTVSFSQIVYIETSDYREDTEDKGYRRLTKLQPVGLKYVGLSLSVIKEVKNSDNRVAELVVKADRLTEENKPKAFIHWVSEPATCEVRLYDQLFIHKNPEDSSVVPGGFLSDCNPNSLKIMERALIDKSVTNSKVYDKYQFERIGYFSVDPDSSPDWMVFNRTVSLREDSGKT